MHVLSNTLTNSSVKIHTHFLLNISDVPPILLLYTDGLIAMRTAPSNSWANPVERVKSIVNIGLQGVGVMRRKGNDTFEKAIGMFFTNTCTCTCNLPLTLKTQYLARTAV